MPSGVKRGLSFGKVKADQVIRRLSKKAGTGHTCYADVPRQPFGGFQVGGKAEWRNIHQHIISTLGLIVRKASLREITQKHVSRLEVYS